MKTSKFFSAAVVAVAMLAAGSSITSCSKDSDDTVPANTNKQQTDTKKIVATKGQMYIELEFGQETFKTCDVTLVLKDAEGKETKEVINENNTEVTNKISLGLPGNKHFIFKKKVEANTLPATMSYRVEMKSKDMISIKEGEIGMGYKSGVYALSADGSIVAEKDAPLPKFYSPFYGEVETDKVENVADLVNTLGIGANVNKTFTFTVTANDVPTVQIQ